jgi:DNA-binding MarR family transcriptional regulator
MFRTGLAQTGDKRARALAERVLSLPVLTRRVYAPIVRARRLEGLEPLDLQMLVALVLTPAASVAELSETLEVIPQTTSKALRRLRERDLVREARGDHDGRERRHVLTGNGRRAIQRFLLEAERRLAAHPEQTDSSA